MAIVMIGVLVLGARSALRALAAQRLNSAPHPVANEPQSIAGDSTDITAETILARMTAAYATCRTYSDKGVMVTTFRGPRTHESQRTFETRFARDVGFRFEYTEAQTRPALVNLLSSDHRMVIWTDGEVARCWWSIRDEAPRESSLDSALSTAVGVSGGLSARVPRKLFTGGRSGREFLGTMQQVEVPRESCDGHECWKLAGVSEKRETVFWIDCDSYLIRRVREAYPLRDDLTVEEITVYEPTVDAEIESARLTFVPPK
jgi:hypothetical protein